MGRVRGQPLRHAARARSRERLRDRGAGAAGDRAAGRPPGRGPATPEAQLVFLAPPSWAALVSRLAGRGSEPPAVQERRLALAQAELDAAGEFDVVVVNDDVARAADELVGLLTAPSPGLVPGE